MGYKVGEICDINLNNITKSDNWSYIKYLDTSNLNQGIISELQYLVVGVDKIPSRARRIVKENDILISTVRPDQKHYGILKKVEQNMIVSTGFAVLSPKANIVHPDYLYNFLIQEEVTLFLQAIAETSTSAYPSIKSSVIADLKIQLPPLQEQKAIAHILSTIDEKIEVNNQINKKLEEMAQTIFKHWFMDFEFPNEDGEPYKSSRGEMVESELGMIPKGWEVVELDYVTEKANTGADAIRRAPIVNYETSFKCVRVGDLSQGRDISEWGYCEVSNEDFEKFQLRKDDIIITRTGTIGLNIFIFEDLKAVFNNGLIRLRVKNEYNSIFIYQVINSENYYNHISKITGETSTRPNMKINYLLKYKFVLPPANIKNKFVKVLNLLHLKIYNKKLENDKLIQLRDTLLPKLMSGELRVPLEESDAS